MVHPLQRLAGSPLRWSTGVAAVVLLGACATGAPPRSAAVSLPPAFGAEAGAAAFETDVLDTWWTLYGDAELTARVERALAQGFSVREALSRLEEARALRSVALARYDPQGGLQGNAEARETRTLGSGSTPVTSVAGLNETASLSLPISWELDLVGRRQTTERAQDADLAAARFDVEGARAAIAAEVARTVFQSRGLAVQRGEALETLRIQRELARVVGERARRGLSADSEADRIAADVAQAEAQAADLAAALEATRRALLTLTGEGTAPATGEPTPAILAAAPTVPATMPGELLARRPDVRKAATRVRRAASNVRLAELDFFPRFTLNPGLGLTAQRGAVDSTFGFWSLAAGLTLPILDRPRLQAQLDAEGARAEQAVLAYERTVQTAFSEADQALTRLAADRRRVDLLAAGEARARRAYDAALKRYELGFAGLQELLDAERAWRATRVSLTAARTDALQRSVQVFQALGGGWNASAAAPTTRG